MGRKTQHRFHGDPERFEILAEYIHNRYLDTITYIADVAGGQGMLSRILSKRYGYHSEVVDPEGPVMKGVRGRSETFTPALAGYYDLIVGLHPDQATRAVAEAARLRPAILIPCCNFWCEEKLSQLALIEAIEAFYGCNRVRFERISFAFRGPKNIGLVSDPGNEG